VNCRFFKDNEGIETLSIELVIWISTESSKGKEISTAQVVGSCWIEILDGMVLPNKIYRKEYMEKGRYWDTSLRFEISRNDFEALDENVKFNESSIKS
jgi:hypothetical protein